MRSIKAIGITVLIMALWYTCFSLPALYAQAPACDLTGDWNVVVNGQECLRTPFNSTNETCFPYGDTLPPTFTFMFNPNNGAFRGTASALEDASRLFTFAGLLVGSNIGTATNRATWNFPLFKSASCGGAFAGVLSGFITDGTVSPDCTTLNFTLTDPISLVQTGIQGNCTVASAVTITGPVTATRSSAPPPPPPPPPPPAAAKMQGPCCQNQGLACVGEPCDAGSGNKYQEETDYTGAGAFPLVFQRFYNSLVAHGASIGQDWTSSYSQSITLAPSGLSAVVTRPEGKALTFTRQGDAWIPDADVTDKLIQLTDTAGNLTGWQYTTSEKDKVEAYNADGQLVSITNRAGLAQTLAYDAQGRLISVTDPFSRTLTFTYDDANRIATLTDPAGGVYAYSYDAQSNLVSVLYPDGTTRTYHYEDARFPNALTGITDENGQRFATFSYDTQGKVTLSTHAAGAGQVTLTYNADGTTTVTDALGTPRIYTFDTILGVIKNTAVSAPCTACGSVSAATTYDANGNVASRTDFNGNVTQYTYDLTRNLETSRVEAFGAADARTITTEWHPTFRLLVHRAEPLRITTNVYDDTGSTCGARGALCSLTLQATSDPTGAQGFNAPLTGTPRIWTFTYDANGQVLTVDGPRTTVPDITTDTYDQQGNLASVTNALGQVTPITQYDANGKPLTILDPNGLVATLAYDVRQRLTSRTVGTETTSFTYDSVGQLTKVTLQDGSFLAYAYDAAHRLIVVQNSAGDRVAYTLDAMGNRVEEDVFDPQDTLTQTGARVYDNLNRLVQDIGAQSQVTQYAYDPQGNRTGVTDPLNQTTLSGYDTLNRLVSLTDPANGKTGYAYNGQDQPVTVTDPRSLTTQYVNTGLNELLQTVSPDTGTTQNIYDEARNLLTSTDAKGQTTQYTYDALNRVTQIVFADGTTHTYQYDQGQNGLGRLTQITDPSGTTSYAYDLQGRILTETRVSAGVTYVTSYHYNTAGQMIETIYPSGRVLGYAYDQAGRIAGLTFDGAPLLTNIAYQPFGAVTGWTFGNGAPYTRPVDLDGRPSAYTLGSDARTLVYDPASRIVGVISNDPQQDLTFDYDTLDRLTAFLAPSTIQGYAYDADGNRTSHTIDTNSYSYQVAGTSNQLVSVTGPTPKTYAYDANGSVIGDGTNQFTYDARERLIQANTTAGSAQYLINALGQRVQKTAAAAVTAFLYDTQGHLIAESDAQGNIQKEYVYLSDTPVAVITSNQTYFIYTDHLNTPRLIADPQNRVVWQWDLQDPFGNNAPNENPSGLGTFIFNLRFPGQYFDQETGLHYNYFRNYDPSTGRYIESDPIGLDGGDVNLYRHVLDNPVNLTDPRGLQELITAFMPVLTPRGYISPVPRPEDIRAPDFYSGTLVFKKPLPLRGFSTISSRFGAGITGITISIDRNGCVYIGPVIAAAGASGISGGSLTFGYLNQREPPEPESLQGFLSEFSFTVGGGYYIGGAESYTPGSGTATNFGFFTPGGSGQVTYTFPIGSIKSLLGFSGENAKSCSAESSVCHQQN